MKASLFLLLLVFCQQSIGQNLYQSDYDVSLRAPSVPLVSSDPYFSIWSPYNTLTDGNTEHWTGENHPILGVIRVDGKNYRFMGKDREQLLEIIPSSNSKSWSAQYTFDKPDGEWTSIQYDDKSWKVGQAAFGTSDMPKTKTIWNTKDLYIRRSFELENFSVQDDLVINYSHDDVFSLYLNGTKLIETDYSWNNNVSFSLNDTAKKLLRKGKNVIAVHCHNTTGGGYVDFGLYRKAEKKYDFDQLATQKSVNVMPTQTYYRFDCGPVELNLVFTSPLLMDDLDLLSTPISYISYEVKSLDKKDHEVSLYFETTPALAVHETSQPVSTAFESKNGFNYIKTGTIDQPFTKRTGDGVRIDWGYGYLASKQESGKELSFGNYFELKKRFSEEGHVAGKGQSEPIVSTGDVNETVMAFSHQLKTVNTKGQTGFLMIGYDDIYAIEYFYKRRLAYWKKDGQFDIYQAFERAHSQQQQVLGKAKAFDNKLFQDAQLAGGKEYAELCALAYRQAIAAHKLIKDDAGNLLFLSKENHSNGCINTVDITYPSAPLFLIYNPELLKGMMTSIFYYSESGRWNKPYPAHDLGTYPVANGQLYGEDMPVEEAGNMLLLATAISLKEGNVSYAQKHWQTLTTWVEYLADKGLDPDNQLCTDDFAGHLAHNANLSVKAILAIAGYSKMAAMKGDHAIAKHYFDLSKTMAIEWEKLANDQDHYKLAFDKEGTWSQKYNLIWDKVFSMDIFPKEVFKSEVAYYRSKQNKYGVPLDSRADYTKSDWVLWSACLSGDPKDFNSLIKPIYNYANETSSRVPLSDWHDTKTGKMINFKARSVVGGYYMRLLDHKINQNKK